jgi:type II secretory pathway component PulK
MRKTKRSKFPSPGRGVILPVVLFVLVLIGLLAAMFSFRVHGDLAATQSVAVRLQTRLAAEAGVEYAKLLLQTSRLDRNLWYHNPDLFNRIIVTAHDRDAQIAGTNPEFDEDFVFRFSLVADDPADDKDHVRFGLTDEASKLNLNTATDEQLHTLVQAALGENSEMDPQTLVDAILDWRDEDAEPRGEEGDTEGDYYSTLEQPYRVKNGPFESVEELLLVKGITPAILFGEDFDRNGLLTENEKDGDRSFPPDNQDDFLNRGLHPYLTVLSKENNVANNNRPRIHLAGNPEQVRAELAALFPDEPEVVDYVVAAVQPPAPSGGDGRGQRGAQQPGGPQPGTPGLGRRRGQPPQPANPNPSAAPGNDPAGAAPGGPRGKPTGPKKQRDGQTPPAQGDQSPPAGDPPEEGHPPGQTGQPQPEGGEPQQGQGETPGEPEDGSDQQGGQDEGGDGSGEGENPPITSPASLFLPRMADGSPVHNPLTLEHLPVLMDRTTMHDPDERTIPGLINVNTAPSLVLRCLEGLADEQIEAIVATRDALDADTLSNTAWLVTEGVMDIEAYERIAPHITARAQQFTIESLGFADHIGMVTRLEVVVDYNGPIAQTVYYRDISHLGGVYPIRESDKEKIRGR